MIDYVCFTRKQINYSDSNASQYYGRSLPSAQPATHRARDTVYLAMPKQLSTTYQAIYNQVDLGVAGLATIQAGSNLDVDNLTAVLQNAANNAIPEFANSAIASLSNNLGGLLGLAGNIDANSMEALMRGRVFNPFKEQIFKHMQFRTHSFNFKMVASDEKEAKVIKDIIDYFKLGSLPRVSGSDGFSEKLKESSNLLSSASSATTGSRFFSVPDSFEIKFIRAPTSAGATAKTSDLHFKIHDSACISVGVNYTPDGQYTALKKAGVVGQNPTQTNTNGTSTTPFGGVSVPAVNLTLQFSELKLLDQKDVVNGY